MNRRDLLKWIGIGGVGAVAAAVAPKEEAQAAPVEQPKPQLAEYRIATDRVVNPAPFATSGSAVFWRGTADPNWLRFDGKDYLFLRGGDE